MKTSIRKVGVACGTAFASAAIAVTAATSAGASSSALVVGGLGASSLGDVAMAQLLAGELKGQERVSIWWPAEAAPMTGGMKVGDAIDIGAANLSAAIDTALGKLSFDANGNLLAGEMVTVVGLSAGSLVVDEAMRQLMAEGDIPDPDTIRFIVLEDSLRAQLLKEATYSRKFDYTYQPPPATPYDVIVITGEYDGLSDMPDRRWNFLAVANAMAGKTFVHVPVMFTTDLDTLPSLPEKNIRVEVNEAGGTTTYYLVPTKTLPLVQMLPFLKPREAELKAKIDKGYSRNDPVATTAVAATVASSVETTEASPTEVQPAPTTDAAAKREARAEARAEAQAERAEAKAERAEARAAAKAEAAAKREARRAARAEAASGSASSADGSGSPDSSTSSE